MSLSCYLGEASFEEGRYLGRHFSQEVAVSRKLEEIVLAYLFGKITIKTQQLENVSKGFVWESKIPRPILVHNLRSIEIYIASLRYKIRISIGGKL